MNSPKNLALVVLAVAAIGSAVLVWRQQLELQALRLAALGTSEKDELKRRAAAAEKRAQTLAADLAAAQDKLTESKAVAAKAGATKRADDTAGPANIRTIMNSAANMMNRPEVQRMMALQQKAALDASYAKLFKQLGLAPDKLEQLKRLMVERQTVGSDVFSAAMQQGLDPMQNRREIAKLTADGQAKVDGEIKSLLGDGDFSSYQNYQATLPQRNVVNQLAQSLSYTASPLTDDQSEQLVQILAQNPVARPAGAPGAGTVEMNRTMVVSGTSGGGGNASFVTAGAPGGPMPMLMGAAPISEAAVAAARPVLTDPQLDALQQMQQQQAQMRAAMQSMGAGQGQGGMGVIQFNSATVTTGGTPPPPPPPVGDKPPGGD